MMYGQISQNMNAPTVGNSFTIQLELGVRLDWKTSVSHSQTRAVVCRDVAREDNLDRMLDVESKCIAESCRIQPQKSPELVEGSIQAVSYTHLRAHETRHDLVCRLLLEKKKKK